jgi:hypothetical protein
MRLLEPPVHASSDDPIVANTQLQPPPIFGITSTPQPFVAQALPSGVTLNHLLDIAKMIFKSGLEQKQFTFMRASTPRTMVAQLSDAWERRKLDILRIRNLQANWDGEGASAFSFETANTAEAILELAASSFHRDSLPSAELPKIVPMSDGTIIVKWIRQNRELKCIVDGERVEVLRWSPIDNYASDDLWEVDISGVGEHIDWLLR